MTIALRRSKEWNRSWMGETLKDTLMWINVSGSVGIVPHPDPTQRIRIRTEKVTIGQSVSWHLGSDKDGNAVGIYDEDEETVKKFYEKEKSK
jgi:hypothetical protein